jgi:hypothetical protein
MEKRFFSFLFRAKTKEDTREVRQCGNCDKLIGKLEKRYTYKEKIVCEPCYNLLQKYGDKKAADGDGVEKEEPVEKPTEKPREGPIENGIVGLGVILIIVGLIIGFTCVGWFFFVIGVLMLVLGLVIKGGKRFVKEIDEDSNNKK